MDIDGYCLNMVRSPKLEEMSLFPFLDHSLNHLIIYHYVHDLITNHGTFKHVDMINPAWTIPKTR
jgi:hypothetical protein